MKMETSHRFQSLGEPEKYGYWLHADYGHHSDIVYRGGRCNYIHDQTGVYETLGDGNVQHSPDMPVGMNRLADYCASLANYCRQNPDELPDVASCLKHSLFEPSRRFGELFQFFAKLRYDEKHSRRYFSVDSDTYCKVSASESKRHDKRWERIESDADGTSEFVWNMLCRFNDDATRNGLSRLTHRLVFEELCRAGDVWVSRANSVENCCGISGQPNVMGAYNAMCGLVRGHLEMTYGAGCLSHYVESLELAKVMA